MSQISGSSPAGLGVWDLLLDAFGLLVWGQSLIEHLGVRLLVLLPAGLGVSRATGSDSDLTFRTEPSGSTENEPVVVPEARHRRTTLVPFFVTSLDHPSFIPTVSGSIAVTLYPKPHKTYTLHWYRLHSLCMGRRAVNLFQTIITHTPYSNPSRPL